MVLHFAVLQHHPANQMPSGFIAPVGKDYYSVVEEAAGKGGIMVYAAVA